MTLYYFSHLKILKLDATGVHWSIFFIRKVIDVGCFGVFNRLFDCAGGGLILVRALEGHMSKLPAREASSRFAEFFAFFRSEFLETNLSRINLHCVGIPRRGAG